MSPWIASEILGVSNRNRSTGMSKQPLFYWPSRSARKFAEEQRLKSKEEELKKREISISFREKQVETALELFRSAKLRTT